MSHLPIAYPVAVGAALAYQRAGERRVALAICGDGATSNGRWHEAINTSAVHRLPVVWVVNNNQFAYSTPNPLEFAVPTIAERAVAYGIPGVRVDGGDVLEVYEAAQRGRRARARRRRPDADRVRVAAVARPRRPRPREVHAARAARGVHGPPRPGEELRGVAARAGRGHEGRHRRDRRRASRPSSTRATSSRRPRRSPSPATPPRAVGRGRLLDERARPRRRDGGRLMATTAEGRGGRRPATAPSRAASAPTTARPRT